MAPTARPTSEYLVAANSVVSAANGIDYAYRQVGDGTPPLVLLQHFRGNLDNWDPAVIDALFNRPRAAAARRPWRGRRRGAR
jgi:pimeloyl-ACP methyl ester carboxylesterase